MDRLIAHGVEAELSELLPDEFVRIRSGLQVRPRFRRWIRPLLCRAPLISGKQWETLFRAISQMLLAGDILPSGSFAVQDESAGDALRSFRALSPRSLRTGRSAVSSIDSHVFSLQ